MSLQDLRDKRSKLLFDAHAVMSSDPDKLTSEHRANVDKMLADANTLKTDIERMDVLESEYRSSNSFPRAAVSGTVENRSVEERREATNKALRNYLTGKQFESRDLTVSAEGIMIPVGVADPKIALKSAGTILDLVYTLTTVTGESMKAPMINDTAQGFVLNSAGLTTTDPSFSGPTISVADYRMNPIKLENSLITDSSYDLVSFVENATVSRYARAFANLVTIGDGGTIGALTGVSTSVTTAANSAITYTDLVSLFATLDPAYQVGAAFVMSNATLANQIMNIKDTQGRPIFMAFNDGGTSGFAGTIFGFPVKLNPYQPAFATSATAVVQFGNFEQGYTFRKVAPGVVIKRLNELYAETNKTGFVGFCRVGGAVTDAGTHPIINLNIHA